MGGVTLSQALGNTVKGGITRYSDVALAVGVVVIVGMMVIPLPPALLDFLLVANLSFALVTLLTTMYVKRPLDLAVFPALLLVATLFRLALNVSSTRLILLDGFAGRVIQQFGQFVVGGNPVVGFVVFLILVIIQFIVITRGAERVAEVAARFTLDAMPGRQMSIDADLSAGLINEEEARRRREEISKEADFYGAMDGASKFVKGDAIAGLVITGVNIIGGFVVGVVQRGLSVGQALQEYTLLTVGDGLVSQIPALLLSTAAGIVVTRAPSDASLGRDVSQQMLAEPKVLLIGGAVLAVLGLVPGLPALPFFLVAGILAYWGWFGASSVKAPEPEEVVETEPLAAPVDEMEGLLRVDPLEIELGYGLLIYGDASRPGNLLEKVASVRQQIAGELGMILPLVRVRDNVQLSPNDYVIRMRGVEVGRGKLMPGHYLAINPGDATAPLEGIGTVEPAFGLEAVWIDEDHREDAELGGYTVVDPPTVLSTHLARIVRQRAHELLGRQETRRMLDYIREQAPALVDELIPDLLKVGDVQKVLKNLLREGVPIRDLITILETLADRAPTTRDPDVLTEFVRQSLAPQLAQLLPIRSNRLDVITLDPAWETKLTEAIKRGDDGTQLALSPAEVDRIIQACRQCAQRLIQAGSEPVILAPPLVRFHLRRLVEHVLPDVPVIGYGELPPEIEVRSVGVIRFED